MNDRERTYLLDFKKRVVAGCEKCKGRDSKCSCQALLDLEIKKVRANIPLKYLNPDLSVIPASQRRIVEAYLQEIKYNHDHGRGLCICGGTNSNRAIIMSSVLCKALELGYSIMFSNLEDCVALVTKSWSSESLYFNEVKPLIDVNFLVLDEVGVSKQELPTFVLNTIFKRRENNLNPIILSSHLSKDQLKNFYPVHIYSEIEENLTFVDFPGTYVRQK